MRPRRPPVRADEGFAMSSPLAFMSAAAVLLATVTFFATGRSEPAPVERVTLAAQPAPVEQPVTLVPKRVRPTVVRGEVYVSVYNNSNITGLAGTTASRIGSAGWQVVGSDNWYGTIPATTIYFPPSLQQAARMLATDLGISRLVPAVDPMLMDRLTVILTADFA